MNMPGKPIEEHKPKNKSRTFAVQLDGYPTEHLIDADHIRWENGLVTFWKVLDNPNHDHLIVAYPVARVHKIKEQA